jgi:hypothetical protein
VIRCACAGDCCGAFVIRAGRSRHAPGREKLFAETIFTEPRVAGLLAGMPSPIASNAHKNSVVAPQIEFETQIAVADAVRAPIADMYYFRCHQIGEHHYSGGVIDLFPIEIAAVWRKKS